MRVSALLALLAASSSYAQNMTCTQDSDCLGCGWVCGGGRCYTAVSDPGQCTSDTGCTCAGQRCTGVRTGMPGYCEPVFAPRCLCDADCDGGQICDALTYACHARPAAGCRYDAQCGCGCACDVDAGTCACDGGCATGPDYCLSGRSDAGLVMPPSDAGHHDHCLVAGATCSSASACCTGACTGGVCACAAEAASCVTDPDCCDGKVCVAHACRPAPVIDGGTLPQLPHLGCGCSSAAPGAGMLLALATLRVLRRRAKARAA